MSAKPNEGIPVWIPVCAWLAVTIVVISVAIILETAREKPEQQFEPCPEGYVTVTSWRGRRAEGPILCHCSIAAGASDRQSDQFPCKEKDDVD